MLDLDRHHRPTSNLHYTAALRRLSTRAASLPSIPPSPRLGLDSFSSLTNTLKAHLISSNIPLLPGLTLSQLTFIESSLSFTFPPDLRALLLASIPSSPSFPDWHHPLLLLPSLHLPFSAARKRFPSSSLNHAPLLIPIYHRCYIPARPSLAGNPVFFIDDDCTITCCAVDLVDFFSVQSPTLRRQVSAIENGSRALSVDHTRRSLDSVSGKTPRWIEFWSDAAAADSRRKSFSAGADQYVELKVGKTPVWVELYLERIGNVLKDGGWKEDEVEEMFEGVMVSGEGLGLMDKLVLKVDKCSNSMRRAGWSCDEVEDLFGFEVGFESRRRKPPTVRLKPNVARKVASLVEMVAKC